jgi:hypothetical protein
VSEDIAENTILAKGEYALFFERNKDGIEYVSIDPRTYFIRRGWTIRGPIPRGARIEHVGLANSRRAGKVKQKRGSKRR